MDPKAIAEILYKIAETAGITVIALGIVFATITFLISCIRQRSGREAYKPFRQDLGRSIVLGLEFLVAGDVIRLVAHPKSFHTVGIVVIIIAIRALLAVQLEMEIQGRWPWQEKGKLSKS